jgi:hypothetical protein
MMESQIAQLAATVPPSDKGKIPGQPKDLETTNLINIHSVAFYYTTIRGKVDRLFTPR